MKEKDGSRRYRARHAGMLAPALCLAVQLFGANAWADAKVYEDAEDRSASRWIVFDDDPPGASVSNVFDATLDSRVIRLLGSRNANGYRIGGLSAGGGGWDDTSRFHASWWMRGNRDEWFAFYVVADTARGTRYFQYTPSSTDRGLYNDRYVHHRLDRADGSWTLVARDLVADLADAEPGNTLRAVHGLMARGSMRLDDITLADLPLCE